MATRGAYGTTEQNARRILDSLAAKGLIDPRKNYAQDDREDTALNQLQGLMTLAKQTAQFHEEDGRPLGDASLFNALAAEGISPNAEQAGTTVTRDGKTYRMTDYADTSAPGLSPSWFIDDPNYGQLMDTQAYAAAHPSGENSLTLPILAASGLAAGAGALGYGSLAGGAEGLGGLASGGGVGGGAGGVAAAAPSGASAGTLAQFGGAAPMFGAEAALGGSGLGAATGGAGTGLAGLGGAGAATGAGMGGLTAGGVASGGSALSNILGGTGSQDDYLKAIGAIAPGVLGYFGAGQTADAASGIANQLRADRAPALAAYNNALQNPNDFYNSAPAMGSVDAILRKLSTQGNPAANPGLLSQAAAYNLGGYNDYLKGLSGPAFGTANTEATVNLQGAQSQGGQFDAVGLGLGRLLNPQSSLEDTMKKYGLTIGGVKA